MDAHGKCLLYSFGSANNYAWEHGMHEALPECEIHTFDHTIHPVEVPSFVHFHRWGVGGTDRWISRSRNIGIFTFATLRRMLGHDNRRVEVLKCDVEGAEYDLLLPLVESGQFNFTRQLQIELHYERIPSWFPPRGPFLLAGTGKDASISDSAGVGVGRRGIIPRPKIVQPPDMHHRFFWALMRAGWVVFHKEPNIAYAMGACVEYSLIRLGGWDTNEIIKEARRNWCVGGWRNIENAFLPRCKGWGALPADADVSRLRHLGYESNEAYGRPGRPRHDVVLVRSNRTGLFEKALL